MQYLLGRLIPPRLSVLQKRSWGNFHCLFLEGTSASFNLMHNSCHLSRAYCARTGDAAENKLNKDLYPPGVGILVAAWPGDKDVDGLSLNPGATYLCDLEQVI